MVNSKASEFLFVRPGDYVAIKNEKISNNSNNKHNDYWIGKIISCIGGARNPKSWTLFQVVNIDSGGIMIINADLVDKILKTSEDSAKQNL